VLGFTMIGPEPGEVVAAVQTALLGKLPYTVRRHPDPADDGQGAAPLFGSIPAAR
jgi:hypothetical protein